MFVCGFFCIGVGNVIEMMVWCVDLARRDLVTPTSVIGTLVRNVGFLAIGCVIGWFGSRKRK